VGSTSGRNREARALRRMCASGAEERVMQKLPAWAGWKKVEMRYWVYVADLGNDRYWVGVGKREQLWGANIDPIIMQPARAKAEAMYLLADTSDRILANGFKCNAIRGNSRIGLPSAPKSGVQLSLSG
jgi:hypothetical protein